MAVIVAVAVVVAVVVVVVVVGMEACFSLPQKGVYANTLTFPHIWAQVPPSHPLPSSPLHQSEARTPHTNAAYVPCVTLLPLQIRGCGHCSLLVRKR